YWLHGNTLMDITKVISDGVVEKGMLAWKNQLSEEQINSVAAYIWTIRGSNPPNPKAPQGKLYE
ncbi:MAG: cytochrome oxidase subunit III, partial [Candidatus Dadabacteria bacterium]